MENAHLHYQRQAIMQAAPEELITHLYDMSIRFCYQKDGEKVQEVLTTLIRSLNFEYEISTTLFELYDYCRTALEEEKYDEVRELLEPVREAWVQGVGNNNRRAGRLESRGFLA